MSFVRSNVFTLLIILLCTYAYGQEDYYSLRSQGNIPADFTTLSSKKYEQDRATIDKKESRSTRSAKDEFMLKSNYGIDEILRSGKVLFNDSISVYLNKVKDQLLKDDPKLRNEIRIYVTKSSSVNAFATNNGIILVNLGLISQLETEAQLAYVLSHEITHYIKKHTINEFVENKQISKGQGEYQGMTSHERELASCRYSQDTELEADLEGLELFKKSSYSTRTILDVFYVLEFAYLPFDDVPFEKNFFNTPDMTLPSAYFLDKVKDIKGDTTDDDSKSSHPSVKKRREKVSARISSGADTKEDFIVSKSDFLWCRNKSRMEICRLLLLNRRYEEAFYHSYLLLKKNPESKYLKKTLAKSLYGLSKYKSEDKFYKVHVDHDEIEGESQQVYYMFDKLTASELSALATAHLWTLRQQYPDDPEVKMMSDDLMNVMVLTHYQDKSFFATKPRESMRENAIVDSSATNDTTSKYAKIKKKIKSTEEVSGEDNFIRYVFIDLFKNAEFESAFDRCLKNKKDNDNISATEKTAREEKAAREEKRIRKRGYALGIDRVVMVDPFYARINTKKKQAYRFQFTEDKKMELGNLLKEAGAEVGVQTETLIPLEMSAAEAEKMNDYALMEEWIHERLEHELDSGFVSPIQIEASRISKKYGTSHFGWSGMVWYTERNKGIVGLYVISIVYPFVLPYAVYETFSPSHRTLQYTLLYDLNTGKEKMHYVKYFKNKDVKKFTSAGLYYTFLQIKTRAK